ncbi:MAG: aminotransferase class I/II-fold pyridoxal phosphate-dependent enzyme, partial [Ignavibacteria bacterium]|nr:aminotransferase class I/II-fold pyridoxal phosphate-dependent enzyme [Ignavibacteria bacterium]
NLIAKSLLADFIRYKHNDMNDLERVLSKLPKEAGKLIVTDGIFSTFGTIADLPTIVKLAKEYNARILVDDAHSVGVIGKGGRGTASHFSLENEVDMTMGTFSKTFASLGGFVAADSKVINYLKHHSPALIFSASPTPASVAAALAALDILEAEPERIEKLQNNSKKIQKGFKELGFKIIEGDSAIVPVIIGDDMKTFIFWRKLYDAGVFVNAFVSPGVPQNMAMLRTSYMATHEDVHLDKIISVFEKIGKELGIIN